MIELSLYLAGFQVYGIHSQIHWIIFKSMNSNYLLSTL